MNNAVVCVDDTMKPESIPSNTWVKRDNLYHILKVSHAKFPVDTYFFELEEIDLTPYPPYKGFNMNRFKPFAGDNAIKELLSDFVIEEV